MLGFGHTIPKLRQKAYNGPPINTVAPVISGTFEVGEVVSCTTGSWIGLPPITYSYQWLRNGTPISGATSSTYTIVLADDTEQLSCEVTATNAVGSASAVSNSETVGSNWILLGGTWNDTGVWEDSAVWID